MRNYPSRIKCALLGWHALMRALDGRPRMRDTVTTTRAVRASAIPDGRVAELPAGTRVITQALGGSFTLWVHGQLMRLRGADADAIGNLCQLSTDAAAGGGIEAVREQVWQVLRTCYDRRSRSTSSSWAWSTAASSSRWTKAAFACR